MNLFQYQAIVFRQDLARSAGALLGIAQGLLADGHVNDQEVLFLRQWLDKNSSIAAAWPGNVIYAKVAEALADGEISNEERAHLTHTLQQLVGGSLAELANATHVTELALDDVVGVEFSGRQFCLTGDFVFGPRSVCTAAIERRGGMVVTGITKKLDYVIVGGLGSQEWKHGSFGTKLEKAMEYRQQGAKLRIVHEDPWAAALSSSTSPSQD